MSATGVRRGPGAAIVGLLLLLAACAQPGSPGSPGSPRSEDVAAVPERLPVGELSVASGEIVWAAGRRLQVGERSHQAPARITELAVGPHGIYYVAGDRLRFTDLQRDEEVSGWGYTDLVQSPDRRYVGFLDFGTTPASAVAYDLETGEEVARSDAGMGEADQDLTDLYEDGEPLFLGFDEEAGYSQAATDDSVYRLPLDGSAVEEVREGSGDGRLPVLPPYGHGRSGPSGAETSPDGTVRLEDTDDARWRPVDASTGRPTGTDLGRGRDRFLVGGWLDGHTVYGAAGTGRGITLRDRASIVVCDLHAFRCNDVWGPVPTDRDGLVIFPGRHHLF